MRKIAIFVEGQAELIFVRELLLKCFDYQVDIECRTLFAENNLNKAEYDFPNDEATSHIQIINVGMDGNVLTRILSREQFLINAGYENIIGLRDMYSKAYRDAARNQLVDPTLNENFVKGSSDTIQQRARRPESMNFCFAIMELEAWWLGITSLWSDLDPLVIKKYESAFINPESVFHPAALIDRLYQTQNSTYSKSKGDVESIVSRIDKEHYAELYESQRCRSFCEFVTTSTNHKQFYNERNYTRRRVRHPITPVDAGRFQAAHARL